MSIIFVIKGITDAPLIEVIRGSAPFVLLMIGALVVLLFVPQLATVFPELAGFRM